MRISLIGMSGAGKSHWTQQLSAHGLTAFYCDDLIEKKLSDRLSRPDGRAMSVGEWMGFPNDPGYERRESAYLDLEISVLSEIFDIIRNHAQDPSGRYIVDTTGSVIYTGAEMLADMRRLTTVVHLETPPQIQDQMLAAYLENRRPVLWRGYFRKNPGETDAHALARCYPQLIYSRERLYERYAHVTIEYAAHSDPGFGTERFLKRIAAHIGA